MVQVLNYEDPATRASTRKLRRSFFIGGLLLGEVFSILLLCVLFSEGPIFPVNVIYPHLLLIPEAFPGIGRTMPAWLRGGLNVTGFFILGPMLFRWYGLLCVPPRSKRWITVAVASHLLLFLIVAHLRDAFLFL